MPGNLSQFSQELDLFVVVAMVTASVPSASNPSGISFPFFKNRIGSLAISKPLIGKGDGIAITDLG